MSKFNKIDLHVGEKLERFRQVVQLSFSTGQVIQRYFLSNSLVVP